MDHWQVISEHISQTQQAPFSLQKKTTVGGGSINSSYHVTGIDREEYFVKLNSANLEHMFQVEFDSLNELSQALATNNSTLCTPSPICFGTAGSYSYLVLEHLDISSSGDNKILGQSLAEMHKITASQFGWYQNNMIGSTPQSNRQHSDWLTFWREERMVPQFEMLYDKGYRKHLQPLSDQLLNSLGSILADHSPEASLLHGDLWSGNYGFVQQGFVQHDFTQAQDKRPVIFDPALYYGDRETDIAMTELFGGFSPDFYQAYNEHWPLNKGYEKRKTLYKLYHILNHANLFGTSYLNQAISMMEKLC
ncbi:MAG: fructosamine kinase family protein [Gammaproteobacteria bacterium]|nr:fructosamine kinase family protein [Gammaproteobacteria bacterium]